MKNHIISLILLICFSGSIYSQDKENPWLLGVGVNSINADDFEKSGYKLPSLSLSRYIFNNFSLGVNYSNNNIFVYDKKYFCESGQNQLHNYDIVCIKTNENDLLRNRVNSLIKNC